MLLFLYVATRNFEYVLIWNPQSFTLCDIVAIRVVEKIKRKNKTRKNQPNKARLRERLRLSERVSGWQCKNKHILFIRSRRAPRNNGHPLLWLLLLFGCFAHHIVLFIYSQVFSAASLSASHSNVKTVKNGFSCAIAISIVFEALLIALTTDQQLIRGKCYCCCCCCRCCDSYYMWTMKLCSISTKKKIKRCYYNWTIKKFA